MPLTLVIHKTTGQVRYVNEGGLISDEATECTSVVTDLHDPFRLSPAPKERSVEVKPLIKEATISAARVARMVRTSVESFCLDIGFYGDEKPEVVTGAIWMSFKKGVPETYKFLVAGPTLNINFKIKQLMGFDGKTSGTPDTEVKASKDLSSLTFRYGSNVTNWIPIEVMFQDSMETPGCVINWGTGATIYVRFKVEASSASNNPNDDGSLVLEAIVIPEGPVLENLVPEVKQILSSGACMTFYLWRCPMVWYMPSIRTVLPTTPGLLIRDQDVFPPPSEALIRWQLQWIFQKTRRGGYALSNSWEDYFKSPHLVYPREMPPFNFVVNWSKSPSFAKPTKSGLPVALSEDIISRALTAAARSALSSRHQGPREDKDDPMVMQSQLHDERSKSPVVSLSVTSVGNITSNVAAPSSQTGSYVGPALTMCSQGNPGYYTSRQTAPVTTTFKTECNKCTWTSIVSSDGSAYQGMVAALKLHIEQEHNGQSKDTKDEEDNTLTDGNEFKLATTPKLMPACKDDRNFLLCPGRWLPGPVNWMHAAKQVPQKQEPVYTRVNLNHLGLEILNRKTVRLVHDRRCRELTLQMFSTYNLRQTRKTMDWVLVAHKGKFHEEKEHKELQGMADVVRAWYNFVLIWRHIHPGCLSAQAAFSVLLDNFLAPRPNVVLTVPIVEQYFYTVVNENADRALRTKVPYSYEECQTRLEHVTRLITGYNNPLLSHTQQQFQVPPPFQHQQQLQPPQQTITSGLDLQNITAAVVAAGGHGCRKESSIGVFKTGKRKRNNWCQTYNTPSGCNNTQTVDGCTGADGVSYKHGCNVRLQPGNRYCGKRHKSANHK